MRAVGLAFIVIGVALAAACSEGDAEGEVTPTATFTMTPTATLADTGPGELRTIASGTQLHLEGVAIGAGNIWEEEYVPAGGTPTTGLTAMLFISPTDETIENSTVRVHPGQEIDVPGYRLRVVAVEENAVQLAVEALD